MRLGILYYYIATDADQPQRYYALAQTALMKLLTNRMVNINTMPFISVDGYA